MRVLLDTNILIHREAATAVRDDIGILFRWLDKLTYEKCIHPSSIDEINTHADPAVVKTFRIKLSSYRVLATLAPDDSQITAMRAADRTVNDEVDTSLLSEVKAGRVDLLITEDRGIHRKGAALSISSSVFTIDSFLEKVTAESPDLADYKVLSVRKVAFGSINLADVFFDSFRRDYPGFDAWFNHKADEPAYVCTAENGSVVAFLYLKREDPAENYTNLTPPFTPARRLKIGSFKVISNGFKLGERFLKIAFDNALVQGVNEIYVTIFRKTPEQDRLYRLLEEWGFDTFGKKTSVAGTEDVLVRSMKPNYNIEDPRRSYPYLNGKARKFIVPIYPEYHTELLPDSILNTESPRDFVENRPNRNAISKVYVSRSLERGLQMGDIIVFYRTKSDSGPAHHTSVATSLGVVQEVFNSIPDRQTFIRMCRKRSVFTDDELRKHWEYSPNNRPFVVNFLYVHSFPKRPNLRQLKDAGVITEAPRGFERITDKAFESLLEIGHADKRLIVR